VTPRSLRLAEAGVLVVMVLWAGNFVVVKNALAELPPVGFTFSRFVLAAIVLLAICRWREGSISLPRRDVLPVALLGAVGIGIYQTLWTTALGQTTASDSALLIASTPIFTALIAGAIRSDRLTPLMLLGAGVSFAGVALVVLAGSEGAFGTRAFGNVVTLLAAACWAAYISFSAPVLRRHSPLRTTAWAIFFGSLVMLPIGGAQLAFSTDWSHVTIASLFAVLYSGLLSSALGNVLHFWGVMVVGPTRTANFQFLVPALAVGLAAIFLGEQVRPEQLIGGAVIVLGILVARSARRTRVAAHVA